MYIRVYLYIYTPHSTSARVRERKRESQGPAIRLPASPRWMNPSAYWLYLLSSGQPSCCCCCCCSAIIESPFSATLPRSRQLSLINSLLVARARASDALARTRESIVIRSDVAVLYIVHTYTREIVSRFDFWLSSIIIIVQTVRLCIL